MSVHAKCHNYTGCLRAYRGEDIELPAGTPLVCPECGKPLTTVQGGGKGFLQLLPWLGVALVLAVGAVLVWPLFTPETVAKKDKADPVVAPATPAPATPAPEPTPTRSTPLKKKPSADRTTSATPAPTSPAEPPATVQAPQRIDLNPAKAENRQVKEEVLKRIDLMPNITQANKDKLYNSVERARSMGKLLTIPFGSGKTSLGASDIEALRRELENPEIMKRRDDPTAVFVILGYADPKGDEKKNLEISQTRADSVLGAMRDKIGVANVMHAVAMGGQTLLDEQNLEKNRIVEVWAVLP